MAAGRERVALDDASWLQMDSTTNQMVVNVLLDLDGPLDWERLVAELPRRLIHRFPRFTQRVVAHAPRLGVLPAPHWEPDPSFSLDHHLERHVLASGDEADLMVLAGHLASLPLDRARPRWRAHLIDRPHRSSILLRTHHSMADGLGLVQLLYAVADGPSDGRIRPGEQLIGTHRPRRWPPVPPATSGIRTARVYRKLAGLADQENPLRRPLTGVKQLAVSSAVDLDRMKAVASPAGATVNDVGLAVLAGALRSHLVDEVGVDQVPDRVGVTIPYNLRPSDQPLPAGLGNQVGLVFVNLPLGIDDPVRRIEQLRAHTSTIKDSPEGEIVRSGMAVVGALTHRPTAQAWMRLFTRRSTAIVTNIVGPQVPLELVGVPIHRFVLWVPTSGSVGLGLSLVSYAGQMRIGVQVDTGVVADARALSRRIDHELRDLDRYGTS